MIPDTTVNLGDFQFAHTEVPAKIAFGGSQALAVHKLVGGTRLIDAMGPDEEPLEWSGLFFGQDATDRALYLESMRVSGVQQDLTWGKLSYSVVVKEFHAEYERFYQIPYRICCEVIANLTTPVTSVPAATVDTAINNDASFVSQLSAGISSLTAPISALNTAISSVQSFATAAPSVIASVLQPLSVAQTGVRQLIASGETTLGSVSTFGGVIPSASIGQAAGSLLSQSSNLAQLGTLYQLNSALGRMSANLSAVSQSPLTVTLSSGNLFELSDQQYGDAMDWTSIAKANGLTDPFIDGVQTLNIPSQPDNAGGVLNS